MACLRKLLPILAASALLGACASQTGFTSLSPRAAEFERSGAPLPPCLKPAQGPSAAAAAAEAPAPADDPALAARIAALAGQARQGQADFARLLPQARASARRAGASGSEGWIAAQQDISRLQAARAPTVDALAELDALSVARSADPATSAADRERVTAAADEVRVLAAAQQVELDSLGGRLSGS
jgi:hypothetical protein